MLEAIKPDHCYPLPVFMKVAGMGRHAMATARRRGLRVLSNGTRKFVRGSDWIDFLERSNRSEDDAPAPLSTGVRG